MGQQTDPVDLGSRRAMVLTLTAAALMLLAGLAILHTAGGLHLGPATPRTPTVSTTPAPSTSTP
ncbi:hypothetical protein GCM10009740_19040 [Terrabacter terrae]|uniref:Uncharacterized protein n=1 Tax=Terrabacter terrae TaxID=318434 RepID=A0ABN2U543_9MICO